jgi:hypothetical protein
MFACLRVASELVRSKLENLILQAADQSQRTYNPPFTWTVVSLIGKIAFLLGRGTQLVLGKPLPLLVNEAVLHQHIRAAVQMEAKAQSRPRNLEGLVDWYSFEKRSAVTGIDQVSPTVEMHHHCLVRARKGNLPGDGRSVVAK